MSIALHAATSIPPVPGVPDDNRMKREQGKGVPDRQPNDAVEWTTTLADCIARVYGIDPLTEVHWRVISECREEWAGSGKAPDVERLAARSHLSVADLRALFPPGQSDLAWILSGLIPPGTPSGTSPHAPVGTSGRRRTANSNPKEGASPSLDEVAETLTTKEKQ